MLYMNEWGSARHASNVAFVMSLIGIHFKDQIEWHEEAGKLAQSQINYMLGNDGNGPIIEGRPGSYVVGYGDVYPTYAHHASSNCPPYPERCDWSNFGNSAGPNHWTLYGALIGGPKTAIDDFENDREDYVTNEVTLDYNCGFTGLAAAMLMDGAPPPPATTTRDPNKTTRPTVDPTTCKKDTGVPVQNPRQTEVKPDNHEQGPMFAKFIKLYSTLFFNGSHLKNP